MLRIGGTCQNDKPGLNGVKRKDQRKKESGRAGPATMTSRASAADGGWRCGCREMSSRIRGGRREEGEESEAGPATMTSRASKGVSGYCRCGVCEVKRGVRDCKSVNKNHQKRGRE